MFRVLEHVCVTHSAVKVVGRGVKTAFYFALFVLVAEGPFLGYGWVGGV